MWVGGVLCSGCGCHCVHACVGVYGWICCVRVVTCEGAVCDVVFEGKMCECVMCECVMWGVVRVLV